MALMGSFSTFGAETFLIESGVSRLARRPAHWLAQFPTIYLLLLYDISSVRHIPCANFIGLDGVYGMYGDIWVFRKASAFVCMDFLGVGLPAYLLYILGQRRDIGHRDVLGTRVEGIIGRSGLEALE